MYRTLVVEDEAQEARHLTDLLTRCDAAARERGKCVSCSVNTAQAVVQLDFTDGPGAEEVLVQQPDEGNEL